MINAIDLFAGPGGWDLACEQLGFSPLGIEWDEAACQTRDAAGLRTIRGDVSALSPVATASSVSPLDLLIASPPGPTFSSAGKGDGLHDMPLVYEAATAAARGKPVPELPWRDERSALVVEPLRWATLLEPRFLAWEQVPPMLPFWEHCAEILRKKGWNVWTGVMEAERYGVPQTRERAILMADREAPVHPPRPTHQRYVKGEPQRHEVTLEGEVLPWVSMAEALGWTEGERPSPAPTVSGGGTGSGGGVEVFAGRDARNRARGAVLRSGQTIAGGNRAERSLDEPAISITSRADNNSWVYDRRQTGGDGTPVGPRPVDEPAPTIAAQGLAKGRGVWTHERPAPTIVTTRRSKDSILVGRQLPEGEGENVGGHNWPGERPSTTVNGDPRISKPGRHDPEESGSQQMDAIRVTLEEAAILQSFPPDYPFQGTKSQRFLQVGNAVPPLLALAILTQLLPAAATQPKEVERSAA